MWSSTRGRSDRKSPSDAAYDPIAQSLDAVPCEHSTYLIVKCCCSIAELGARQHAGAVEKLDVFVYGLLEGRWLGALLIFDREQTGRAHGRDSLWRLRVVGHSRIPVGDRPHLVAVPPADVPVPGGPQRRAGAAGATEAGEHTP